MPEPYWSDDTVSLWLGDCREVLAGMPDASVDAVVTDPPYEISFMSRAWDGSGIAFDPMVWRECLRVLKPGGHLLAFGGTRTWHRVAVAIEDAGWEIRDTIMWIHGQGFPKSLDVAKAIDKAAGAEREVVGSKLGRPGYSLADNGRTNQVYGDLHDPASECAITAPATDEAARWEGWGTALKPGWEPIILARKLLAGTVALNVLEYGTGALNIAACRIPATDKEAFPAGVVSRTEAVYGGGAGRYADRPRGEDRNPSGRWPTNLVFSHSASCVEGGPCEPDCPIAELDRQSGVTRSSGGTGPLSGRPGQAVYGTYGQRQGGNAGGLGDQGGASRFFPTFRYEAKAPASERPKLADGTAHATVKPLDLMRWLVRLITPPGGVVLDPFAGSGTTGEACVLEGFGSVLIELEQPHAELIKQRLRKPLQPALDLFSEVSDGS